MAEKCKGEGCHYFAGPSGYCKNHDGGPTKPAKPATRAPADPDHKRALAAAKRAATLRDKPKAATRPTAADKQHTADLAAHNAAAKKRKAAETAAQKRELADAVKAIEKWSREGAALRLAGKIAAAQVPEGLADRYAATLERQGKGAAAMRAIEKGQAAAQAEATQKRKAPAKRQATDRLTVTQANRALFQRYGDKGPWVAPRAGGGGFGWWGKGLASSKFATVRDAFNDACARFG